MTVAENIDLHQLPEFRTSPSLASSLSKHGTVKSFKAGSVILNEAASIGSIPIVVKGLLKVLRTDEDGREILLYYISAGESCVMSFLAGMHNETSKVRAEVEEDAEILFVPITQVSFFIKEHPEWLDYIFKLYHKRFEELLDIINAVTFKKIDERLLELLKKKEAITQTKVLTITHEQLANELGTSRVVISRLLKQLEDLGNLQLGRGKIKMS